MGMIPVQPSLIFSTCPKRKGGRWLLLAFLAAQPAFGGGPREFLIQNWSREDGLPGTTVTAVAQTPEGYLWVGTLTGLARFDGVRFVAVDLSRLASQSSGSVFSLFVDHKGDLWIGMGDGHLIHFSHGKFTSRLTPSHQTADRYVQRIAEDGVGGLWTLNYEGGVSRLAGNLFTQAAASPDILGLVPAGGGGVWVGSRSELLFSDGNKLQRVWDAAHEPGFQLESIATAHAGGCWIAGKETVRRFEGGRMRETRGKLFGKPASLSGFLEDLDGDLWLGSYGGGILVLGKDGITRRLTRQEGLPSDLVRCLFQDREGNIWAGLEARGLVRIRQALFASYGRTAGMSDETVLCVSEDSDGNTWFGTNGEGVYRIARDGQIRQYGVNEGLTNQFVWALQPDGQGRMWVGTWGGGLFQLEGERFVNAGPEFSKMPVVLKMYLDRRGALWFGQRSGPERLVASIESGRLREFAVPGRLARLEIRNIAETTDGSMWFGTEEEGLLRWKDNGFTRYDSEPGPTGAITALAVDNSGALWAAGDKAGLIRLEKDRFTLVVAATDLPGRNIMQITDDGLGYLWFGTENGVFRVPLEGLRCSGNGPYSRLNWQRFTQADGLPSDTCNKGGCRSSDGRIWFSTLTGAAVLDPREAPVNPPPPAVLIEEVFLAGKHIYDAGGSLEPRMLKIPPGGGPLDLAYTALNFAAPRRVHFRYELTGLDHPPVEAGSARSVRYNYLPPGEYEFGVTACIEGGDWNPTGASLKFEVLPHYWQTWWFRVSAITAFGVFVAGSVAFVLRTRHRGRIEQLERLHALERERTRIARDIHDDLGGSLTEISLLGALAARETTPAAETRAQVSRIVDRANELTRKLDEIVWVVNPNNDSVAKIAPYLCQFVREFLEPTAIMCRFEVQENLPSIPLSAEVRHNIYLVLKEALNNCVRHSDATQIQFNLSCDGVALRLGVSDNGCGFNVPTLDTTGNGLRNMRQRAEAMGAEFSLRSEPAAGTTLTMALALSQKPRRQHEQASPPIG